MDSSPAANSTPTQPEPESPPPTPRAGFWLLSDPVGRLVLLAIAMLTVAVLAMGSGWADWYLVSSELDTESTHVFLVIPFAAAIIYVNRAKLKKVKWGPSWLGAVLVLAGYASSWWGYHNQKQSFYHFGSITMALGAVIAVLGHDVLRKFWPVALMFAFMVPMPNQARLMIAQPLQSATAATVAPILELFGEPVARQNSSLTVNGKEVLIVEACNGLRMVFTLILACWLFAFITPLKNWIRWLIILLSPGVALVCNVVRLIPTLWMYAHASSEAAEQFHDYAGWAMLFVAFLVLMSVIKFIEALGIEVRDEELDGEKQQTVKDDSGSGLAPSPALGSGMG